MSKTREVFYERKRSVREARRYDKWLAEHEFACIGLRRRHGKENQPCGFPVRFSKEEEGQRSVCRYCKTHYVYAKPMTSEGFGRAQWMTKEAYDESVPAPDSVEVIETHEKNIVALVGHAKFCHDRSKPLIGCKAVWRGSGDIAWYLPGRSGMWHRCQSTAAARDIALAAN